MGPEFLHSDKSPGGLGLQFEQQASELLFGRPH